MANEAVRLEVGSKNARRYTCADGTSISGGVLCKVADPYTASAGTGVGEAFAGICSADKVANDGSTNVSCWVDGIYDLTVNASVGVTVGDLVIMSGANLIAVARGIQDISGGAIVGKALETGSASEVIRVAVGSLI